MSNIVTRANKGEPLLNSEMDANFINLNQDKAEKSANLSDLADVAIARDNLGLGNVDNTADASKSVASAAQLTTPRNINGVAFDGTADIDLQLTTDVVPEGAVNAYFTPARVLASVLVGLSLASGAAVAETDSVLSAFGKLQAQSNAAATAMSFLAPKDAPAFTGAVTITANNTNPALRITQTGSGYALLVEDDTNPDATPFHIDTVGRVVVGHTSAITNIANPQAGTNNLAPSFQVNANTVGGSLAFLSSWFASGTQGGGLVLAKSNSGVVGTHTIVANGTALGYLSWQGSDGTDFMRAASIHVSVDGTPGVGAMPGIMILSTSRAGTSAPVEALRLDSAQNIAMGGATTPGLSFWNRKQITGSTIGYGFALTSTIQPDVTAAVAGYSTNLNTSTATFTLNSIAHFDAAQSAFGAGSTVTTQYGFRVNNSVIGATNNYGFFGNIAAGTGRYNFYASGTADNYFAGKVGINSTAPEAPLHIKAVDNVTTTYPLWIHNLALNYGTGYGAYGMSNRIDAANQSIDYVFDIGGDFIVNTGNTARFFINDTGNVGIGITPSNAVALHINKQIASATTSYGIWLNSSVAPTVTAAAIYARTDSSTSSNAGVGYTLTNITHYSAAQGTFHADSAVTEQAGFVVSSSLIGGVSNYGFYGNIPAGTNRWNIYMAGTANNYLAGNLAIGQSLSFGPRLSVFGGTLPTQASGLSFAQGLSAGRLATGDSSNTTGVINSFLDQSVIEISAGTSAPAGVVVTGNTAVIAPTTVRLFTNSLERFRITPEGGVGIGGTPPANYSLLIAKNVTGSTSAYGISNQGVVLSDVTSSYSGYITSLNTQAAAFTLTTVYHYIAQQGTLGAGSVVTNQNGFIATSSLVGATNNYGFRGTIPAGTNRWNLYMDGTAANYLAGQLMLGGSAPPTASWISVSKNGSPGGSTEAIGVYSAINSDAITTAAVQGFRTNLGAVTPYNTSSLTHFYAVQGTVSATVASQFGFRVYQNLTDATSNYAFYGELVAAAGDWNLYMAGTASNYLAGALGIGATTLDGYSLRISRNITGSTQPIAMRVDGTVQTDATVEARAYDATISTAAAFTLPELTYFNARQGTFSGTVTSQFGFRTTSNMVGATNNYGFYGSIPAGTNRYNIYMAGTAMNYLAGELGIGAVPTTQYKLLIGGTHAGSTQARGISVMGSVNPAISTSDYIGYLSQPTVAAGTLPTLYHYYASQTAFTGTVTTQIGYLVDSSFIGATSNRAFQGNIPAGSGRFNMYCAGSADNYLEGKLGIGGLPVSNRLEVRDANCIVSAVGTAGYGAFEARGSGTNAGYLFFINVTNGEQCRITGQNNSIMTFHTGVSAIEGLRINGTQQVLATGAGGLGYGTGAGGTVTQLTSKTTGVTIDKPCGQITMHNAALAAGASVIFTVTNSKVALSDVAYAVANAGVTDTANYTITVLNCAAGSFRIKVTNVSAGSLSEALVITFVVVKGSAA